jgi:type IV pilus assembly protein PilV
VYNRKIAKQHQSGSSLIEILVAVFILAAGLLGLASMQMLSLKNINNAQFHTLATTYAYDMAERMRSNREAGLAGSYDNITSTVSDPGCSNCSAAQMAQLDGFQWNQLIQSAVKEGGLPEGKGTVVKAGSVYNISVTWKEQQQTDSGGQVGNALFTLTIQI